MEIITYLSYVGMAMLLLAFFLSSREIIKTQSWTCQTLNAAGALILMIYAIHAEVWAFGILDAVWLVVACYNMYRLALVAIKAA